MKSVGLIGVGAIGRHIVENWSLVDGDYRLKSVLARSTQVRSLSRTLSAETLVTDNPSAFLDVHTDIVIEAAGHAAACELGPPVLTQGRDLYLLSVGVAADEEFVDTLRDACRVGNSRVLIPSGALAGFDGLMALARHQNAEVRYTSRKPVMAWEGTPAASLWDLASLTEPKVVFEGSARDAARLYPKNANLAAAVALAGAGLDHTRVQLVADPGIEKNVGSVEAWGALGRLFVEVSGEADPSNPKTSAVVGASVLSALANQSADLTFI